MQCRFCIVEPLLGKVQSNLNEQNTEQKLSYCGNFIIDGATSTFTWRHLLCDFVIFFSQFPSGARTWDLLIVGRMLYHWATEDLLARIGKVCSLILHGHCSYARFPRSAASPTAADLPTMCHWTRDFASPLTHQPLQQILRLCKIQSKSWAHWGSVLQLSKIYGKSWRFFASAPVFITWPNLQQTI